MRSRHCSRTLSRAGARSSALRAALATLAFTLPASPALLAAQAPPAQAAPLAARSSQPIAPGLYEIVASQTLGTVFVASAGSRAQPGGAIVALDPETLVARDTFDLSQAPPYGLAINDRTRTLYATNTRNGTVTAIDAVSGKVLASIRPKDDSSAHLFRILVDEETNTVYAAVASKPGKVWVIDGAKNELKKVIDGVGETATSIALDRQAHKVYVTSLGTNEIITIDLDGLKVSGRFPAGGENPTQLAFDQQSGRLFVTNQKTGDVTVLDARSGKLLRKVPTGEGALGIGYDPGAKRLYVANRMAGMVTVIDATTYDVIANVNSGSRPNTVAVDARNGVAYVTNKVKSAGRDQPPMVDPEGDTVTRIK